MAATFSVIIRWYSIALHVPRALEPRDAANPVRALGGRVVIPPKLGSGLRWRRWQARSA